MITITKVEYNYKVNRLTIHVHDISLLMESWESLKVYKATAEDGTYAAVGNPIPLSKAASVYTFTDTAGTATSWYSVAPFKSPSTEGTKSSVMQATTEIDKIGWTFRNYAPPPGEWGKLLTADDMRYTFMWGIDCTASDIAATDFTDEQFDYFIMEALGDFEKELTIDIRKKVYKTKPDPALVRSKYWRNGVDYTDEEDPYPHEPLHWQNYGFLQLRHMPVISVERAIMYNPVQGQVIDLLDANWLRLTKKTGQIHLYPTGGAPYGPFVAGVLPWRMYSGRFPGGFQLDYTTGYPTAEFVPEDLRSIIGKYTCIKCLQAVGDGIAAGFSSQSVGIDGLSESFSSTQCATSIGGESWIEGFGRIEDMYRDYAKYLGQSILSYNGKIFEYMPLLDVVRHDSRHKRCFKIVTDYNEIVVTEDHSLFDAKGKEVKGIDIRVGTPLLMRHGPALVRNIQETRREFMYDLSVEINENFIANQFVAHNSAFFGARILSYQKEVSEWLKRSRMKYGAIPMVFIGY